MEGPEPGSGGQEGLQEEARWLPGSRRRAGSWAGVGGYQPGSQAEARPGSKGSGAFQERWSPHQGVAATFARLQAGRCPGASAASQAAHVGARPALRALIQPPAWCQKLLWSWSQAKGTSGGLAPGLGGAAHAGRPSRPNPHLTGAPWAPRACGWPWGRSQSQAVKPPGPCTLRSALSPHQESSAPPPPPPRSNHGRSQDPSDETKPAGKTFDALVLLQPGNLQRYLASSFKRGN